jgi:NADPH-dependent curcumin reductase CurA
VRGRLLVVGFISEYANNVEQITQPRIYHQLFWKAASVRGFLMPHYKEYIPVARDRLLNLFYTDKLQLPIYSTQFNSIESIPASNNCDKVVVKF